MSIIPTYTVKEVAEILKVSPKTVRLWIKSGKLKAAKAGITRVTEENLNSFLKGDGCA